MITRLPAGRSIAAIGVVLYLALLLAAGPVSATSTATRPSEIAGVLGSTVFSVTNAAMIMLQAPNYPVGIAGIAVGTATALMAARDDPDMPEGLVITGGFAVATGLIALWYRHTLNHEDHPITLAPGWQSDPHGGHIVVTLTRGF